MRQRAKAWVGAAVFVGVLLAGQEAAIATLVTVDQVIYQNGAGVDANGIAGTVDITSSDNSLTILIRNTSLNSAFTDSGAPALMLLTGLGLQLPGVNIIGGTVSVPSGSTTLNFDTDLDPGSGVFPQSLSDISNQWGYNNAANSGFLMDGVLDVDSVMSSVNNGQQTRFASGVLPGNINGPGYGAISANETQFGSSTPGILDTIKIVLDLDGTTPSWETIEQGNIVLAFGSPNQVPDGGTTLALLGVAVTMLGAFGRRTKLSRN